MLLSHPWGIAVNDFYYRYTLHAAEAVASPFGRSSIRTYRIDGTLDGDKATLLNKALNYEDVFLVSSPAAELVLEEKGDALSLGTPDRQVLQVELRSILTDPSEFLERYSARTDRWGFFRKGTFYSMIVFYPAALFFLIYTLITRLLPQGAGPRRGPLFASGLSFLLLAGGGFLLSPGKDLPASFPNLSTMIHSDNPGEQGRALRMIFFQGPDIASFPRYEALGRSRFRHRSLLVRTVSGEKPLGKDDGPPPYSHGGRTDQCGHHGHRSPGKAGRSGRHPRNSKQTDTVRSLVRPVVCLPCLEEVRVVPGRISGKTLCCSLGVVLAVESAGFFFIHALKIQPLLTVGFIRMLETVLLLFLLKSQGGIFTSLSIRGQNLLRDIGRGLLWSVGFGLLALVAALLIFLLGGYPPDLVAVRLPPTLSFSPPPCRRGLSQPRSRNLLPGNSLRVPPSMGFRSGPDSVHRPFRLHPSDGTGISPHPGDRGILFATAYEVEGSLVVPIVIHALGNSALFFLSYFSRFF